MRKRPSLLTSNWLSPVGRRAVKRVHNRFRDLDERWKSASTGRRTACPTYSAKRLIQQGGAGGFACRSHGHNQWSASKLNKFPKTVMHPQKTRSCGTSKTTTRKPGSLSELWLNGINGITRNQWVVPSC